eukprot:TRINITY_DN3824_c2_g1_i1.p1 TRINITY_DN3824_c2_g1~~TRINITY_DN3824_c2_g1_i1.p1  ORF type:complete len:249 (-),score=104.28 TRINITY_DN3824_c2_g1_i1:59-805(-)
MNNNNNNSNKLRVRKSFERGDADHEWLKSKHTFSFASYFDFNFMSFGCLRVINEDHVQPTEGFGTHGHKEMEIFSYLLNGELTHKDSMGNVETLKRGDVQLTSAGTGIKHSEYNMNQSQWVHFLQIWCLPNQPRLQPSYKTKSFSDEQKLGHLIKILSHDGSDNSILINSDVNVYASIVIGNNQNSIVEHTMIQNSKGYLHLSEISDGIKVNDIQLHAGDGLFIDQSMHLKIEATGQNQSEFVLIELF